LHRSGNTWVHTDLSLLANATDVSVAAVSSPMGCVRPGNTFSVVYTGRAGHHVHALQISGGAASHVALTNLAGAPRALESGHPGPFVRGDGVVVVIYIGVTDNGSDGGPLSFHVDQLALTGDRWLHSDLTELSHTNEHLFPVIAAGYVRANRVTSVVF